MERVRKSKVKLSLESLLFVTPEQKLLRFLVSQPTTEFTPRVLSSKLKGVRGLGGADGINRILRQFEELGLVQFMNNNRSVRAQDDHKAVRLLKIVSAVCDLEGLQALIEPFSSRGILFGNRATGKCNSDSLYDLFVVSDQPKEIERIVSGHPLRKQIELLVWEPDDYIQVEKKSPELAVQLEHGIVMWGPTW